jgi:hypothetical protein
LLLSSLAAQDSAFELSESGSFSSKLVPPPSGEIGQRPLS